MDREPRPQRLAPTREQIELELARIEQSPPFRSSPRHRTLLRHLVDRALDGDVAALKESVIAVEVFGRPADRFDPKTDTIVRVEARRLRARLAEYYRSAGREAGVRVELPVGGYVPRVVEREAAPRPRATRRARDLTERGEHYLRQPLSQSALEAANERFDAALRESPDWVAAHVGRGRAWLNLATGWYVEPAAAARHAGDALRRALELDPAQAVAQSLLAAIQSQFERDWPAARRGFKHAIELAPQDAFVHSAYGCHLRMHQHHAEAEAELQLARQLDPHYLNTRNHMINLRLLQRRYDDAGAELDALRDLAGETLETIGLAGAIAMYRGDAETAVACYERAVAALPDYAGCAIALATAHALAGRTARADELMADVARRFDPRRISPYVLAIFETRRGRADAACDQLERTIELRDPLAVQIAAEPSFDALRTDPRWPALVQRSTRP